MSVNMIATNLRLGPVVIRYFILVSYSKIRKSSYSTLHILASDNPFQFYLIKCLGCVEVVIADVSEPVLLKKKYLPCLDKIPLPPDWCRDGQSQFRLRTVVSFIIFCLVLSLLHSPTFSWCTASLNICLLRLSLPL